MNKTIKTIATIIAIIVLFPFAVLLGACANIKD